MEKKVNIFAYEENVPEDVNNLQTYAQDSLDHVVQDAIMLAPKYTGFAVGKSAPIEVTVAPGRFYKEGRVYAKNDTQQFSFVANLPISGKRIALISVWGRVIQTDPTPRNVLIAASSTPQNPVYQPQILEKTEMREAVLGVTFSAEAPDPGLPTLDAAQLAVAKVTLNSTGVEHIEMYLDNVLLNLAAFDGTLDKFTAFEKTASSILGSLASDVAGIWGQLKKLNLSDKQLTGRMLGRIAILEAKEGIPSLAADSSADFFLNPATSDIANPVSDTLVDEGVRFPHDGLNRTALQLFNPIDPAATVNNGQLLPAYTTALRFQTGNQTGVQQISAYPYQTQSVVQKTMSRIRIRWGNTYTYCTNSAFWQSGQYNPVTHVFSRAGETFLVDPAYWAVATINHSLVRFTQYWEDRYEDPYWEIVTNTFNIAGASVAQSFFAGQDFWLSGIAVQFTALDATNPCTMILARCEETGEPNLNKVLSSITLTRANLTTSGKTMFTFPRPMFLESGKRYCFQLTTAGNHSIATCPGVSFNQGMYFGVTGGYPVPDPTRHIVAEFHACRFTSNVAQVNLQGLQLVGGIVDIDILTGAIVPGSTNLTFQVQVNGVWTALNRLTVGQLNAGGSLPPLLPFRVVFDGTGDCMPAVDLLTSEVTVSRPKKTWHHIWPATPRTPPVPTQEVRCMIRYESFDPNHHIAGASLVEGNNVGVLIAPASWTDATPEPGVLERTYVWNLPTAIASYKLVTDGRTDSALITFHAAWLKDWNM